MKNVWLITFRSITFAQRGERILRDAGIRCGLRRIPGSLAKGGCGYCLWVPPSQGMQATAILQNRQQPIKECYILDENGNAEAWPL